MADEYKEPLISEQPAAGSDSEPEQPAQPGYVPASPVKRAMAWIGVVYMVILVALNTYAIYTGSALTGIAPLLAVPGLAGLGIVIRISHKTTGSPSGSTAWALAALCWMLAVVLLLPGMAGLMSNF